MSGKVSVLCPGGGYQLTGVAFTGSVKRGKLTAAGNFLEQSLEWHATVSGTFVRPKLVGGTLRVTGNNSCETGLIRFVAS